MSIQQSEKNTDGRNLWRAAQDKPGGRDLESQPSIQENFNNLKPNLDQLWKTFRVKMLYQGPDEVKCSMRTSNDERVGQSPPAFALQKANISLSIKDFLIKAWFAYKYQRIHPGTRWRYHRNAQQGRRACKSWSYLARFHEH